MPFSTCQRQNLYQILLESDAVSDNIDLETIAPGYVEDEEPENPDPPDPEPGTGDGNDDELPEDDGNVSNEPLSIIQLFQHKKCLLHHNIV